MKKLFILWEEFFRHNRKQQTRNSSRWSFSLMAFAMMMLVPSGMKGEPITIDFTAPTVAKQNVESGTSGYFINFQMSNDNYSGISGAKIGYKIDYKGGSVDISRLAFYYNSGATTTATDAAGFYLYGEKYANGTSWVQLRGLATGGWGAYLAILNLKPGDKVKFTYVGASFCQNKNNANLKNETDDYWFSPQLAYKQRNTYTVDFNHFGDLKISVNPGTVIEKIEIEPGPRAQYQITTEGSKTTFKFTGDGLLDENDYTIPYLQASFGSQTDFLLVSGLRAEMHNMNNWSEVLQTGGSKFLPTGGSFYEFKPTADGIITLTGSLTGRVHLFVFDPQKGNSGGEWIQKQPNVFYKLSFPDFNNANSDTGTDWYDPNYSFNNNTNYSSQYDSNGKSFSFSVKKDLVYYVCINNQSDDEKQGNYVFHLHEFSFETQFRVHELAKVIDLNNKNLQYTTIGDKEYLQLTEIDGYESCVANLKRFSGNFDPTQAFDFKLMNGFLYISKPKFKDENEFGLYASEGPVDHAGTVVINIHSNAGDATFVVTFPYHASFDVAEGKRDPNRTYGHTWNFMDPRLSDSNIANCYEKDEWGTLSKVQNEADGILSIGQCKNTNSTLYYETQNREWSYSQRQTGMAGGFHDPYYANVWDMEGDNADMIWETEGLRFDTGTNLSCIHNEKDAASYYKKENDQKVYVDPTQPMDFTYLDEDPDRYVGLLPDPNGKSSFTIPCLKDGDRVLIFMKSGEATGTNGIFLNVHGALDAAGTPINENDLYKAGGTNWIHDRYEGCYHFIKNGDGNMKFDMVGGSMCKLLYIRIYQGKRIDTNDIVSTKYIPTGEYDANGKQKYTTDSGHLLFINDKGATEGDYSTLSEHYSGKGQNAEFQVLTYSGNLNTASFTGDNFKISGAYNNLLDFKSKVGEMGIFRLRVKDLTYTYTNDANQNKNYVADLCDRNFTVGYRDKVDYPYTWDFTDVNVFSNSGDNKKIEREATRYVETTNKYVNTGLDISLFDEDGYMKVNSGVDPSAENQIFSADKAGFGNQLWADGGVIAEMRGLWFYTDDNDPRYNDCLQITDGGLRLANTPTPNSPDDPDNKTQRKGWWNYKMVVPSVPANAAVYLRMKRDETVPADATSHSNIDNADVYFLASRFNFGVASAAEKTNLPITADRKNQPDYSCFKVPGTTGEWIVAIKNTTGKEDHLTFTLNGWILEKVAVSTDPKQIGKTGYTTESRKHQIDHTLTAELTGKPIKAYTATYAGTAAAPDYKTMVLTEISNKTHHNMEAATSNGGFTGCILYNDVTDDDKSVSILDGGFHLFVPDMHDGYGDNTQDVLLVSNDNKPLNVLKSFLPQDDYFTYYTTVSQVTSLGQDHFLLPDEGLNKTLILSARKYKFGTVPTDPANVTELTEVSFVRVDPNGFGGKGAFLNKCSAYIVMPADQMKVLNSTNGAKVNVVFESDLFDMNDGIATGVTTIPAENASDTDTYYTLSGMKINRPTQSGLYIKNGKKVYVK